MNADTEGAPERRASAYRRSSIEKFRSFQRTSSSVNALNRMRPRVGTSPRQFANYGPRLDNNIASQGVGIISHSHEICAIDCTVVKTEAFGPWSGVSRRLHRHSKFLHTPDQDHQDNHDHQDAPNILGVMGVVGVLVRHSAGRLFLCGA